MSEQEFIELTGLHFSEVRNLNDEELGCLFNEIREMSYREGFDDAY